MPRNYLISWDSRDCDVEKRLLGSPRLWVWTSIGVYDLVGAPLCRIGLYRFRDAVYCETTNARDWVKLHVRNSRTLQLDKNTDTLSHATQKFCIGKLNFPSCFTECFTDGHCGSINGRCIRNKCHCQDELILSHSRCIQNSKSKCHPIHSALHSLIYAFLFVYV